MTKTIANLAFASCVVCGIANASELTPLDKAMGPCAAAKHSESEARVTDDDYILWFLSHVLTWERLQPIFNSLQREEYAVHSAHVPDKNIKNHIVILKGDGDFVSYYFSGENSFPLCVMVGSKKLQSLRGGLFERDFEHFSRILRIDNRADVIAVQSDEGDNVLEFHFLEGQVNSLVFRARYLD